MPSVNFENLQNLPQLFANRQTGEARRRLGGFESKLTLSFTATL